jgi:hypothetical protein
MESIARTWGRKGVLGFFSGNSAGTEILSNQAKLLFDFSGNSAGTEILSNQAKLLFDFACCSNWQLQCNCPYMPLGLLRKRFRTVRENSFLLGCMLQLFTH